MKSAQIQALVSDLGRLVALSDFRLHRRSLFLRPVGRVLRGFYFEDAGADGDAFYVWSFFMPLYIPQETVSFNFGRRLGEGTQWRRWLLEDDNLCEEMAICMSEALVRLRDLAEADSVLAELEAFRASANLHALEAIAYSLLVCREYDKATEEINNLMGMLDREIEWQSRIGHRCVTMLKLLEMSSKHVEAQLQEWEHWTLRQIGIKPDGK